MIYTKNWMISAIWGTVLKDPGNEWNGNTMSEKDKNESSSVWENICEKKIITKDNDNGILHIVGDVTNDLYAVPMKKSNHKSSEHITKTTSPEKEWDTQNELPPGWEKHEGKATYTLITYMYIMMAPIIGISKVEQYKEKFQFWKMKKIEKSDSKCAIKETDLIPTFDSSISVTRSSTSSALDLDSEDRKRKEEIVLKRRSYPSKSDQEVKERPIRFAVRSLGWVEISEEDLTPERSSKAVNKCIVDLSLGKNDLLDVVGRWGDGKDLFMDLDEGALKLFDPENLTVLNTQPIHTIRVWGVGRDNGR
ncbi:hypothetical protein NQ318_015931 [Aromia moschata]|uniref:PID domain-containing protein n=1 Tax=Aromia moschata TaxID=1265417 RepID=A0AAV8XJB4_9CUCU|nr:hypothetical protein NQ318_015931 [Aromia moschata]